MKRGYRGVYHHISPKHLQRYVNEFAGRFNLRHLDTLAKMETLFSRDNRKAFEEEGSYGWEEGLYVE